MLELALCLLMILLLLAEFIIYGVGAQKLLRLRLRAYETALAGFFLYFGVFQAAALPMVLLQRPFHELAALWAILSLLINGAVLLLARRELYRLAFGMFCSLWQAKGILLLGALSLVAFTCYFQSAQQYIGWDTSYYIGTVNTTVYTDSMYIYDGAAGTVSKYLNLRYALSTFYMHSAVLCKLSSVDAILVQKYVVGTLCILLYALILFAMGKRLFAQDTRKSLAMLIWGMLLNYGFNTIYTTSSFLLLRGYGAKGFCANVAIPAVFYFALCLWEGRREREHWWLLFFVGFASVPLSMSCILIVPALIFIILVTEWIVRRDWKALWRGFWCVLPNGLYLIAYFLYTQGYKIPIHQ